MADNLDKDIFEEDKKEVLNKLLHACADEICGFPGPSFQQYKDTWSENDYKYIYNLFTALLKKPEVLRLDSTKTSTIFLEIPDYLKASLRNCVKARNESLVDALVRDVAKKTTPVMSDFDWRIKYIMGTSKLAAARESLLQLDFTVDNKESQNTISLEMDVNELDKLIETLESVH